MSTLALEPLFDTNLDGDARVAVPDGESGGELTLEALVSGCWEALAAGTAECPVCHHTGTLRARWGTGPAPVMGSCADCGAALA